VFRSFKFLLQPTARQARSLHTLLAAQREVYNAALEERRAAWNMRGVHVSRFDQFAQLADLAESRPDVMAFGTVVARGTLTRLDRAFTSFFAVAAMDSGQGFRGSSRRPASPRSPTRMRAAAGS